MSREHAYTDVIKKSSPKETLAFTNNIFYAVCVYVYKENIKAELQQQTTKYTIEIPVHIMYVLSAKEFVFFSIQSLDLHGPTT